MAPMKRKAVDGEEAAVKADTRPATTRVTRSSARIAGSKPAESLKKETQKVKAKPEGKKKKTAAGLKAEKEAEVVEAEKEAEVVEAEKEAVEAEKEVEAEIETENATEKKEVVQETEEALKGDKKTVVIEHCKQCNSFKTRAIQVKTALEDAIPDISVEINPDKPRRGCLEIREKGGETFISLLNMKRPFQPMKALDMEKVITEIVGKIKGSSD